MKHFKQYLTVGIFTMVTLTSAYAFDVNSTGDHETSSAQDFAPNTSTQLNSTVPSGANSSSSIPSSSPASEALDVSSPANTRPNTEINDLTSSTANKILSTKSSFNRTLLPFGDDNKDENFDEDENENDD